MQLSGIDVNLLVVLHPLLDTRSVSRAARKLGLSPSATSHALARLRELLGDELLVRAGRGLVLTPRGAELAPIVARALASLELVLAPPAEFRPLELRRSFHLLWADYLDWTLLPPLDVALRAQAPEVDIHSHSSFDPEVTQLRDGSIDLAFVVDVDLPPDIHTCHLLHDDFVSIVREGHPCLDRPMTLRRFAALDHLLVSPLGVPGGRVDRMLADKGLSRRVARTFSSFLPAPFLVAQSDYVLTLPRNVARLASQLLSFEVLKMPASPRGFDLELAWHERMHHDPAHRWFRELVAEIAATIAA